MDNSYIDMLMKESEIDMLFVEDHNFFGLCENCSRDPLWCMEYVIPPSNSDNVITLEEEIMEDSNNKTGGQ